MGLAAFKTAYLSEQDYLEAEKVSDVKHEYFDGEIFAMSGAKANHQRITGNVFAELRQHLKGTPCEAFSSDMKVRADNGNKYFYPDVVVCCNQDGESDFTESPRLIVEVLSNSTRKFDKDLKRTCYQTIPTLEEYVLIEQDHVEIEISRKSADWHSSYYFLGDDVTFESIGLTLPVLEIYARVENKELQEFLAKQEAERCL
jgi:Uma2 family endonuclease